jgi:hypothetical protein
MTSPAVKKWLFAFVVSLTCSYFSVRLFPVVFPLVQVQLKMNRQEALEKGKAWHQAFHQGTYDSAVASFQGQPQVQSFIELEGGGAEAFQKILEHKHFRPFIWKVRHYSPHSIPEAWTYFTPEGDWWGFFESLSEEEPGEKLSKTEALELALKLAEQRLGWKPEDHTLLESVSTTAKSGRIDHTFTFKTDEVWGLDGEIRLSIGLSGDRLTSFNRWFRVPEQFSLHYGELRSKNHLVASLAMQAAMLVVLIFGCFFGGLWCYRQGHIRPKGAVWMAGLLSASNFFQNLNASPLSFFQYDTATAPAAFFSSLLLGFFKESLYLGLLAFFLISVADGLGSRAFPKHIQLFRSFSLEALRTQSLRSSVWIGFLILGYFFLDVTGTYYLGRTYLNWWVPSDQLANPDTLSHFFPAFGPLARAAFAGIVEEVGLRAIPLSLGALIGSRFNRRTLGIFFMMILQAIIFGGMHANYPAQPATARLLELILPSLVFGGLYLQFGLIPGMIAHFAFDAILMGLPIWVSEGAWLQKMVLFLGTSSPLLYLCLRNRSLAWPWKGTKLKAALTYETLLGTPLRTVKTLAGYPLPALGWRSLALLFTLTLSVFGFLGSTSLFEPTFSKEVLTLSKAEALELARTLLEERGYEALNFKANSIILWEKPISANSRLNFWLTQGKDAELRLKSLQPHADAGFIKKPAWRISFINWRAPLPERARWVQVTLSSKEEFSVLEMIPESIPLTSLSEEKALELIEEHIKKESGPWTRLSVEKLVHPNRTDWKVVYKKDDLEQKDLEARVFYQVTGSTITQVDRWLHLSEDAFRQFRDHQLFTDQWQEVCGLLFYALFFFQLFFLLPHLVEALQKPNRARTFRFLLLGFVLSLGLRLNLYSRHYESFKVTASLTQQSSLWLLSQVFQSLWSTACLTFGWLHCRHYFQWNPLGTRNAYLHVCSALFCGTLLRASETVALFWADKGHKPINVPQPFRSLQVNFLTEPLLSVHPLSLMNLSSWLLLVAGWLRLLRKRSFLPAFFWLMAGFFALKGPWIVSLQGALFFTLHLLLLAWVGFQILGTNLRHLLAALAGALFFDLALYNQMTLGANGAAFWILSLTPLFLLYVAFLPKKKT